MELSKIIPCGDEFSSIVAEDDFSSSKPAIDEGEFTSIYAKADIASIRSSKATVNQQLQGDFKDKADAESNEVKNGSPKEKQNSTYKLFQQEDAAMIIQSASRIFMIDTLANIYMHQISRTCL
ncbi:protein IQ-DOMAIN 1-like [Forsythia ovata]|uniref:Protein IQ-DOMAIN 1-like n=1 Tax=Forsythia ovata TaxID=205694 RepID=A0ABD1PJB3_9LAMI